MTKPIGYYVDTNIPVVGDIERKYGSNLEGMGNHKFRAIYELASWIMYNFHYDPRTFQEFADLNIRIREEVTEEKDAIALLKAMVNSL